MWHESTNKCRMANSEIRIRCDSGDDKEYKSIGSFYYDVNIYTETKLIKVSANRF